MPSSDGSSPAFESDAEGRARSAEVVAVVSDRQPEARNATTTSAATRMWVATNGLIRRDARVMTPEGGFTAAGRCIDIEGPFASPAG